MHELLSWSQDMSAEVVDSNPYSRLMALQRMGIVANYERIREFSVAVVVCIYFFPSYVNMVLYSFGNVLLIYCPESW